MAEPDLAANHDGRENRSHFPNQAQGHQSAEGPLRAEFHEGMVGLKAQHHPGEEPDQQDDHRGLGADIIDLLDDFRQLFGFENLKEGQAEENERCAHLVDPADDRPAESGKRHGQPSAGLRSRSVSLQIPDF